MSFCPFCVKLLFVFPIVFCNIGLFPGIMLDFWKILHSLHSKLCNRSGTDNNHNRLKEYPTASGNKDTLCHLKTRNLYRAYISRC